MGVPALGLGFPAHFAVCDGALSRCSACLRQQGALRASLDSAEPASPVLWLGPSCSFSLVTAAICPQDSRSCSQLEGGAGPVTLPLCRPGCMSCFWGGTDHGPGPFPLPPRTLEPRPSSGPLCVVGVRAQAALPESTRRTPLPAAAPALPGPGGTSSPGAARRSGEPRVARCRSGPACQAVFLPVPPGLGGSAPHPALPAAPGLRPRRSPLCVRACACVCGGGG